MSQGRISELRELLFQLERKIKPLEWDSSRNQINEFKKITLNKLKEEFSALNEELNSLENLNSLESNPENILQDDIENKLENKLENDPELNAEQE